MASDALFDDKLDLNGDLFLTGGLMNPKELYLADLVCSKDASSSDSGISTMDDFQDIANVTDLSSFMDADLKDIDFSLDLLPKIEHDDDVFDPGVLVKEEPTSPSPTLSLHSSSGASSPQVAQDPYGYHPSDICIKDETNPLVLPGFQQPLSPGSSFSHQQNYIIEPLSPNLTLSPSSPSSSSSSVGTPLSLANHTGPSILPYLQHQTLHQHHLQQQQQQEQVIELAEASGTYSPSNSPQHPGLSPATQHSYIVVPNIKEEAAVPIISSQPGVLIQAGLDTKPAATFSIDAILNRKIKIQPKPGSEIVSPPAANGQWMTTTTSHVPYTSQPIPIISTSSIITGTGITTITDEKSLKRAQRIIKNRESASLSRKRKKEYLTSLEERLQQCREENERLLKENETLKRQVELLHRENVQMKQPGGLSPAKKICLMCFALLLTLNLSPISFLSGPSSTELEANLDSNHHLTGRHLLSVGEDIPARVSGYGGQRTANRDRWPPNLLVKLDEELTLLAEKLNITEKLGNMCPMYFNSTESVRLAEQLRGWMISQEEEKQKNKEKKRQKKKKDYAPMKRFGSGAFSGYAKAVPNNEVNGPPVGGNSYPIQVFSAGYDARQQLLNAIPRRNDTFYVLSFSTDYFLVPATAHNKTMRPRMSLLMPVISSPLNESSSHSQDSVGMMQIDCEILNTNLIHVHRSAFPQDTSFNSTAYENADGNHGDHSGKYEPDMHNSSNTTHKNRGPHHNGRQKVDKQTKYWENLRKTNKD